MAVIYWMSMLVVSAFLVLPVVSVVSVAFSFKDGSRGLSLSVDQFSRFYNCLCNKMSASCTASNTYFAVITWPWYILDRTVKSPPNIETNFYECEIKDGMGTRDDAIECVKRSTTCHNIEKYQPFRFAKAGSCDVSCIGLKGKANDRLQFKIMNTNITRSTCKPECLTTTTTTMATTIITSQTAQTETNNDMWIIIVAVISIIALTLLIALVILGIFLKRKKKMTRNPREESQQTVRTRTSSENTFNDGYEVTMDNLNEEEEPNDAIAPQTTSSIGHQTPVCATTTIYISPISVIYESGTDYESIDVMSYPNTS